MRILAILFSAFLLLLTGGGCGNTGSQNKNAANATKSDKSPEQKKEYLADNVLVKMDSLVSEIGRLGDIPILTKLQSGQVVLTEKEKMVKPTYLLPVSDIQGFETLLQKYRGLMVYSADLYIAELYGMASAEDYLSNVTRLSAEVDNSALNEILLDETLPSLRAKRSNPEHDNSATDETLPSLRAKRSNPERDDAATAEKIPYSTQLRSIYNEELSKGKANLFWEMMVASTVECLFITTQNIEKFIVCFDDRTATETTKRISKLREAIEELIPYHPEMENLYMVLEPLYTLDARNVASLTSELYRLKNDISRIRETLLRD